MTGDSAPSAFLCGLGQRVVLTWPAHGSHPASGVRGTGACMRAVGVAPAPEPSVAPTLSPPKAVPQLRRLLCSSHPALCPACRFRRLRLCPAPRSPHPPPSNPRAGLDCSPRGPVPQSSRVGAAGEVGFYGRVQVGLSLQLVHIVGVTLGPCPPPLPSTPCPQGESMPASDRRLTGARAGLRSAGSSRRLQDSACATGRNRGAREAGRGRPRWPGQSPVLSAPPRPPCGPSPVGIGCSFW